MVMTDEFLGTGSNANRGFAALPACNTAVNRKVGTKVFINNVRYIGFKREGIDLCGAGCVSGLRPIVGCAHMFAGKRLLYDCFSVSITGVSGEHRSLAMNGYAFIEFVLARCSTMP